MRVCSGDGESVYAELGEGSFFGEIGILMDLPRTADVVAKTKCFVACLTKEDVAAVVPRYPEVERVLRFEAEERLAMLRKKAEKRSSGSGGPIRKMSDVLTEGDFENGGMSENISKVSVVCLFLNDWF